MAKISSKKITREKLLERGVALLLEQGYHGTGLQDLLAGIGVPKGSFYNYFASKEDYGVAVIRHYIEPFIRRLEDCLRQDRDALSALRRYFRELIEELERRRFKGGCLLGNLIGEIGDTHEACLSELREAVHRYRDLLEQGLARAQREGSARDDLPATAMADLLTDAWQGALLRMKVEQSVGPLEACIGHLLEGYFKRQHPNEEPCDEKT